IGRGLGHADWVLLGLGGALLHVWNHALFKALLVLSPVSFIHAVHAPKKGSDPLKSHGQTPFSGREIDHLGGLSKAMPRTSLFFLVGAVAICGLPPLNGFVSEFLIYLGLFGSLSETGAVSFAGAAFAAPALALIGALAAACFVKAYGAVFLGTARSDHAEHASEAHVAILG